MSVEAMAIALHHSRARGAARLVLVGIANHDGDGGAWPSVATLAKYAGINVRNARIALRKLEELHEIRTYPNAGGLNRTPEHERPNLYEFKLTCPPSCDGTTRHRKRGEQAPQLLPEFLDDPRSLATPPVASDPTPPVASDPRTVLPTTPSKTSNISRPGNRASASCPSGDPSHRWNVRHGWCADCTIGHAA